MYGSQAEELLASGTGTGDTDNTTSRWVDTPFVANWVTDNEVRVAVWLCVDVCVCVRVRGCVRVTVGAIFSLLHVVVRIQTWC